MTDQHALELAAWRYLHFGLRAHVRFDFGTLSVVDPNGNYTSFAAGHDQAAKVAALIEAALHFAKSGRAGSDARGLEFELLAIARLQPSSPR